MTAQEQMMLEEIEFWRSMIESRTGEDSEQVVERMVNARDLAERRLLMITEDLSPAEQRH